MLVQDNQINSLLNSVLGQTAKIRKDGNQLLYFCKCGHYKRKLEVSVEKHVFHCWVCNERGNLNRLLKWFGATESHFKQLHKILGDSRPFKNLKRQKKDEVLHLPNEFQSLTKPTSDPDYKQALAYLKRRRVTREDILRYNLGYCDRGEYSQRIIIPSYDSEGHLNYFTARSYVDSSIRYINCDYSKNIVGFECFVNFYDSQVTITEGPLDAIAIRRNAIPLFGKLISDKLAEKLIEFQVRRVNVCLDSDAIADSISLCEQLLSLGILPFFVDLRKVNADPSKLGFEKIDKIIENSEPFTFQKLIFEKLNLKYAHKIKHIYSGIQTHCSSSRYSDSTNKKTR